LIKAEHEAKRDLIMEGPGWAFAGHELKTHDGDLILAYWWGECQKRPRRTCRCDCVFASRPAIAVRQSNPPRNQSFSFKPRMRSSLSILRSKTSGETLNIRASRYIAFALKKSRVFSIEIPLLLA
jgi:hypothetical protein